MCSVNAIELKWCTKQINKTKKETQILKLAKMIELSMVF